MDKSNELENDNAAVIPLIDQNSKEKQFEIEQKPPKDKFMLVYIMFLLHGMAILLPWNIFITATDYFTNYKLNTPGSANKDYRENFLFYVSLVGQVSNVIMNALNMFCVRGGGNPKGRMPYAIMLCALVLIFTIILAIVDSSEWPLGFFIATVVSVVINFLATGIYNTCTFYVVSMFPMQYTNAIIFGNNISGIFTTLMSIISKATSPNPRTAAIYYFLSGVILLLTCFVLYFCWPHMKFYRYYERIARENREKESKSKAGKQDVSYFAIIKKTWVLLFSIWLAMFSTLAIFPVFQIGIKSSNNIISEKWFTDITCFLTFNIFITIGNFLTEIVRKPGPKWIFVPVILKALLSIVFVALCNNRQGERNLIPVLIKNDYIYWAGAALYPLVSGYLISLLMMYVPKQVEGKHAGTASMLSALVLVIGVVTGLQFSRVLEMIVTI